MIAACCVMRWTAEMELVILICPALGHVNVSSGPGDGLRNDLPGSLVLQCCCAASCGRGYCLQCHCHVADEGKSLD